MILRDELKDILHRSGLARKQQVLLCLAVDPNTPKTVSEVRVLTLAGGLRGARNWNLSKILGSLAAMAVRTSSGWELTGEGKREVKRLLGLRSPAQAGALLTLRQAVSGVKSAQVRTFVQEAIGCAESGYHRAAVVLLWAGALAVLYDHVVANHLSVFNAEARGRDVKWRDAKTPDDMARMKEYDFLQVLEATSVIGKGVKTELEGCLKLRNGCGHPNSLQVADNRVAAHIETLVLNVLSVFT